jgi:hypothetical protein
VEILAGRTAAKIATGNIPAPGKDVFATPTKAAPSARKSQAEKVTA